MSSPSRKTSTSASTAPPPLAIRRKVFGEPELFARARDGQEQEVGLGGANLLDHLCIARPIAVAVAGNPKGRVAGAEPAYHLLEDFVASAEEVDASPVLRRPFHQFYE